MIKSTLNLNDINSNDNPEYPKLMIDGSKRIVILVHTSYYKNLTYSNNKRYTGTVICNENPKLTSLIVGHYYDELVLSDDSWKDFHGSVTIKGIK